MSLSNLDDLYAAIGYGGMTSNQVLQKILDEYRKNVKAEKTELTVDKTETKARGKKKVDQGIKVDGMDNLLIKFSRCCNPVPGDKIVGYITRGRGVSIHRTDCPNVISNLYDRERLIEVKWEGFQETSYPVEIEASAYDRPGVLSDIINIIGDMKTTIDAVNARASKNGVAVIDLVLEINDKQHLETVMQKLRKVHGIYDVRRVMNQ
jgi:GTP pyrophosphokinase